MDFSENFLAEWIERAVDFALEYKTFVFAGALSLALASGGIVWYRWQATHKAQQAHKTLVETLKIFQSPIQKASDQEKRDPSKFYSASEKWAHIATVCADAYQQYSSTTLAPFFLTYQADALLNMQKHEEALPLLKKAYSRLKNQALKDFLGVKIALVAMDCSSQATQQEGFLELKRLAENTNHTAHEYALYSLGLYFWDNKEFAQAKNYWQQMLVKYARSDARSGGVYTEQVKSKLALITVEN